MEVFRLAKEAYAPALSGIGAAMNGARWNSRGVEMIYTAANRSLAMAEVAVHFTLATMPDDYRMIRISIPDDISLQKLNVRELPPDWNAFPAPVSIQRLGDAFISSGSHCLLQVPSAVTQGDFNFLINPHHAEFRRIVIVEVVPFPFDKRIFG